VCDERKTERRKDCEGDPPEDAQEILGRRKYPDCSGRLMRKDDTVCVAQYFRLLKKSVLGGNMVSKMLFWTKKKEY
jgi:hypothetical protein